MVSGCYFIIVIKGIYKVQANDQTIMMMMMMKDE